MNPFFGILAKTIIFELEEVQFEADHELEFETKKKTQLSAAGEGGYAVGAKMLALASVDSDPEGLRTNFERISRPTVDS